MAFIKRIIDWLIKLFRKLFKRSSVTKINKIKGKKTNKKNKNVANLNFKFDEELPSYMKVSEHDKEVLVYSITLVKSFLEEASTKRRENDEKEIIKLLDDKYKIKIKEIPNDKELEFIIKDLDVESKEEIVNKVDIINKRDEEFKVHLKEVDKVINKVSNQDISILEANEIENEINNVVNDKKITEHLEEKTESFNINVLDIIDNLDEEFIKKVVDEYHKVNYVTISTAIIDQSYEKFKKLEEDFKNHRYNKFYYERELNKLKHDLRQIKNLKNNKEISDHIELLRKELYTKSKDKYDLLYNNEIFMNFDKECDLLLEKLNTKVVDIKPKEEIKKEKKDDSKKKERLENIIKRFQDMELARELILRTQIEDVELFKKDELLFIENIYQKFNNGIKLEYNYEKNKKKTELVILYNELNMAINKNGTEPGITLDHINFRLDDLVEAVEVKKDTLDRLFDFSNNEEGIKATQKIESFIPKQNVKVKKAE